MHAVRRHRMQDSMQELLRPRLEGEARRDQKCTESTVENR